MQGFSPQLLADHLQAVLPQAATGHFCVALSGGLDSTVLLHALHSLRAEHADWSLRAIHIDHQLQASSGRWADECGLLAQSLQIPFASLRVRVIDVERSGVEAAARRARYEALRANIATGETLLTAHHADDQMETVLLALLRGSGVAGAAAMPTCAPFGSGFHVRPLLDFTRAQIESWARVQGIAGIEDPTNVEQRFDRNFLRHTIVPLLKQRWPAAAKTLGRSARHFAAADELLDELGAADFADASLGASVQVSKLRALSSVRRRNLLRYWLHKAGFATPSTRKLVTLERDMLTARVDSVPCVSWEGAEVRRHDGLLYVMTPLPMLPTRSLVMQWSWKDPLHLPAELGALHATSSFGKGVAVRDLPDTLEVRFRRGGEQLKPRHSSHHRTLKFLLNDAHVLPWWRNRLPLIFAGERLIAVADQWIDDDWVAKPGEAGVRFDWQHKPRITGETNA